MCKICIFAGTTEARRLVELLSTQPVSVTACVATEYGETLLPEGGNVTVRSGRIPVDGIIQMLSDTKFDLVIDATHPYAASITESVARACAETGTEYLRLLREESDKVSDFTYVLNAEAAALFLSKTDGNILQTTGSKDLTTYSKLNDFTDRAYARVLPRGATFQEVSIGRVIAVKRRCGLGKQIVAAAIDTAKEKLHADKITIEAQTYVKKLYENFGFYQTSEEFLEDGIPHVQMQLDLTK